MASDPLQFQIDFSQQLPVRAQVGMAQADANANDTWRRWIDGCIQQVARTHEEFTVDDVITALEALPDPPSTHNLAALGPRMQEVSKTLGYMEATEKLKRSKLPGKNGNLHRIWRSLLYASRHDQSSNL